jgi:hypothetical protein
MAMVCFLRQNKTVNAQVGENASHFQYMERAPNGLGRQSPEEQRVPPSEGRAAFIEK